MNTFINTSIGDIFSSVEINGITYYAEFSGKNQWQTSIKNVAMKAHDETWIETWTSYKRNNEKLVQS